MLQFLSENWGNILVAVLVAAAVAGALLSLRKREVEVRLDFCENFGSIELEARRSGLQKG